MKGPGLRIDYDVRRVWRCTSCNTERHTPGRVTAVRCHFCQDHPLMTLIEPERPDRKPAEPLDLVIELHPDDVDAPAFVPPHLREPDEAETPPAENESTATEPETATSLEKPKSEESPPAPTADTQEESGTSNEERNPRRKKNRRKKRRLRKNNESAEGGSDTAKDEPASPTPAANDSFGAGLDTT